MLKMKASTAVFSHVRIPHIICCSAHDIKTHHKHVSVIPLPSVVMLIDDIANNCTYKTAKVAEHIYLLMFPAKIQRGNRFCIDILNNCTRHICTNLDRILKNLQLQDNLS